MSLQSHFYCYPEPGYGFFVCKTHQYAVLPSSIGRHLQNAHPKHLSPSVREAIQKEADQCAHEYYATYDEIMVPEAIVPAIPGLSVHPGSLQCKIYGASHPVDLVILDHIAPGCCIRTLL